MVKRKADSPPVVELVSESTESPAVSRDPPTSSSNNCEYTSQGHVDPHETTELHPFWVLLIQAGMSSGEYPQSQQVQGSTDCCLLGIIQ